MDPDADTSPIDHDPAVAELLTFFDHDHLPPDLAEVARPFREAALAWQEEGQPDLALALVRRTLPGREGEAMSAKLRMMQDAQRAWDRREEALRLLLEARDCAVRAVMVLRRERSDLLDSLAGAEACTTILAGPGRMADLETIGAVEPGATVDPIGHMVGRRGAMNREIVACPTCERSDRVVMAGPGWGCLACGCYWNPAISVVVPGGNPPQRSSLWRKLRRLAVSRRPIRGEDLGLGPESGAYEITSMEDVEGEGPGRSIRIRMVKSEDM